MINELEIREELNGETADFTRVEQKIAEANTELNELSYSLPPYELRLFSSELDSLLKESGEVKASKTKGTRKRRFKFTKRSERAERLPTTDFQTSISDKEPEVQPIVSEKIIIEQEQIQNFKNLYKCILESKQKPYEMPYASGSLSMENIQESTIELPHMPFLNGSIFMTDISNTLIRILLPQNSSIQIRLHNIKDCKLYIMKMPKSVDKQTIVIENCKGCIFHADTEAAINIQNFCNLQLNPMIGKACVDPDYSFATF